MIRNNSIDHRPTESDLLQLLQQSQKTLGQPCWLSWFVHSENLGGKLTLKVTSFRNNDRSNYGEVHDVLAGEPEWQLVVELANVRNELWKLRSGDINLILSMTAFETLEQIPDKKQAQPHSNAQIELAPLRPFAKPNPDSLQNAVLDRMGLTQTPTSSEASQPTQMGLLLAGNIKDVEIASILQAISLCKMTGRLNLNDVSQSVELYFDNGELIHANAISGLNGDEQITGDQAALSIFAWTDGTFKFQHGWKTAQRTVQRRLDGLLLEGAALQDYRSFLNHRNITQSTILFVSPDHQSMSESDFDQALKNGIPLHIPLQKQIFLALRKNAQQLGNIIEDLKIPKTIWLPIIFNLFNLNLISASGTKMVSKTETAFDSVYETIETAQKALLQPESGMLSYPLFLVLSRNELVRSQDKGASFCVAMLEFDHNGRSPDRTALGIISQTFDLVKRVFDIVSFAQPNQCFLLLPQSNLDHAHKLLRNFSSQLASQSSVNLEMKAGVIAVPDEGVDLADILNQVSIHLKNADVRNPIVSSSSTMIFG